MAPTEKTSFMALLGISVLAVGFVSEPETFPVFMDWVKTHDTMGLEPKWGLDTMRELLHTLMAMQVAAEHTEFP